jgi:hypothetical protein
MRTKEDYSFENNLRSGIKFLKEAMVKPSPATMSSLWVRRGRGEEVKGMEESSSD